jgi:hypothetical protein
MAKSLKKCIYKVERGIFGFESKKERDEFLKNPKFTFDFDSSIFEDNPSADKKILKKIFGSLDFNPIFPDETPNFKVTNLEKNANTKNSIISSTRNYSLIYFKFIHCKESEASTTYKNILSLDYDLVFIIKNNVIK